MRTVECLRGRLLAERQASRNAKEDSERMVEKVQICNFRVKCNAMHILIILLFFIIDFELFVDLRAFELITVGRAGEPAKRRNQTEEQSRKEA